MENWKPVLAFEGLYEVSDLGRVRSLARVVQRIDGRKRSIPEKILRATPDAYGYPRVTLARNGIRYYYKVAVLVYAAFKGLYSEPLLRHLDDDKGNSKLSNLAPGTHRENLYDAYRNGKNERIGDRVGLNPWL